MDQALKDRSTEPAVHDLPLEHLEHEICQLSAHLAAAMCRWLVLVGELTAGRAGAATACARAPTGSTGAAG